MKILHISPYVPSINASHAGGVCMGKEVETLKEKHDVYILSFCNDNKEEKIIQREYMDNRSTFIKSTKFTKIINTLLHLNKPNYFAIRSSITFTIKLLRVIKKYDIEVIHAEYTSMAQYYWVKKIFPSLKFNIVEHDVTIQSYDRKKKEATGIAKIYQNWQRMLVHKREKKYCNEADIVFTLNHKDKELLKKVYNISEPIVLIPYYGVDFTKNETRNIDKIKNSICFVGQMGRIENFQAAMRLIEIFKTLDSKFLLTIIGAYPPESLQNCECENIHITGFVDDIEEEILKHQVAVFPLELGAGIKLKVLLAFGLGLPVITTSIGAEGIDEEGNVLILAENDKQIKQRIVKLFEDENEIKLLSEKSKEFVKKNFSWDISKKIFEKVYKI